MGIAVFVGISAEKLAGDTSPKHIDQLVDELLAPYCLETAEKGKTKIKDYMVGGNYSGFVGARKAADCYPGSSPKFVGEQFDEYNRLHYKGEQDGPYIMDGVEYVPVIGGRKKDIDWECTSRIVEYNKFRTYELAMDEAGRKEFLDDKIPENILIKKKRVYLTSDKRQSVYLKGESFADYLERNNPRIGIELIGPEAYVDMKGLWHDYHDYMDKASALFAAGVDDDHKVAATWEMFDDVVSFLEYQLKPDDYIVVVEANEVF